MMVTRTSLSMGFAVVVVCLLGADWPRFRGSDFAVSRDVPPPLRFSRGDTKSAEANKVDTKSPDSNSDQKKLDAKAADSKNGEQKNSERKNIAWQFELPEKGPSSPIVVNGRVIVTASGGIRQDRIYVLCIDATSGEELWRREFWATGRTFCHPTSANAAPTPASDGKRIFAFYSSNDLVCLDLDGNLLWYRGLAHDFPKAGNDVGMAASPVVVGNSVIVQVENEGDSFAAAIDTESGETRWRVDRDRAANWSSPAIMTSPDNSPIVLLQSTGVITGHDLETGKEIWRYQARNGGIASPTPNGRRLFLAANGLTVLEFPDGSSAPSLAWDSSQLRPHPTSPIVDGEFVYAMDSAGILKAARSSDGKLVWQLRVGGSHWATPIVAGGNMYCISQDGKYRVVKLGDKGEILAESDFGETIQASAALVGGALYVRSDRHLWKIAETK